MRNAEIVNGKFYQSGANEPFSGTVTNVPSGFVFSVEPGLQLVSNTAVEAMTYANPGVENIRLTIFRETGLGSPARTPEAAYVLCDVRVQEGMLDGPVKCKKAGTENIMLETTMSAGHVDGKLAAYMFRNGDRLPVVTATLKHGQLDGKEEIYSLHTNRLIHRIEWNNGIGDGTEEAFDESTGNRTMQINNVDGKYDGDYIEYTPNGDRIIHRLKFDKGVPVGGEESFDPKTGKLTGQAQYVNGKLQGTLKRWDSSGKLIYEREYQNGEMLRPNDAVTECTNNRAQAYEQATGHYEESAQRDEWDAACREERRLVSDSVTRGAQ
ncbi:toxin-antitoxin system YwqK family antitoxin [Cupriavidus sp. 30B13]|uniref:toxin-antitoxin system YwqK family antitoxin n=1 Tax=Cupriavidus sp. 30B13 TaxID=3384241 RepID=UPI003B900EB3